MSQSDRHTTHQFGTFAGVFTPSILTIFGLIMFMRCNFVVGQAGILHSLAILFQCSGITLLTALSLAAISTNTPVAGGGAYFLSSRVLGPGFGSASGIALFLAQALSVPFYILGFVEALIRTFPALEVFFLPLCLLTLVICSCLDRGRLGVEAAVHRPRCTVYRDPVVHDRRLAAVQQRADVGQLAAAVPTGQ